MLQFERSSLKGEDSGNEFEFNCLPFDRRILQTFWVFLKMRHFTIVLLNQGTSHVHSNNEKTLSISLYSVIYQLISKNPLSPVQKLINYTSSPLLHHLSFLVLTIEYLRGALNYKAVTKYYDFNLKSGYKPSRMQNGLTTSRSGNL